MAQLELRRKEHTMKNNSIIKKLVGFVTAIALVVMPVSAMAAEIPTDEMAVQEAVAESVSSYIEVVDRDISIYIPSIGDTLYAHLYMIYEYEEGSWCYIYEEPKPLLSEACTNTGNVENVTTVGEINGVNADFELNVSSSTAVDAITVRVNIDIYGEVSWYLI